MVYHHHDHHHAGALPREASLHREREMPLAPIDEWVVSRAILARQRHHASITWPGETAQAE